MNSFDASILRFLNQYSQVSSYFDYAVATVQENNLLKAGALMPILWWFWFRKGDETTQRVCRSHLIATILGALVSLFVGRALATYLPFRVRPLYIDALAFKPPFGTDVSFFMSWSSFPSDHAALLCALASGLWFVSRWAGCVCFFYVFLGICGTRVYMGIHYPTDVLAGAAIGVGVAAWFNTERMRDWLARHALRLMEAKPALTHTTA